jgi:hypothetical protein
MAARTNQSRPGWVSWSSWGLIVLSRSTTAAS